MIKTHLKWLRASASPVLNTIISMSYHTVPPLFHYNQEDSNTDHTPNDTTHQIVRYTIAMHPLGYQVNKVKRVFMKLWIYILTHSK